MGESNEPVYVARPLNGVWATAPYLHNGSVPTLRDLLKPPEDRPTSFCGGGREFDPDAVDLGQPKDGLCPDGQHLLDTSVPGNYKDGHRYPDGKVDDADRQALLEYLKTL